MPKIIKRTTNNRNIKKIFNEFQTRNKIRNLSPKTIIYYEVQTRSLFDFLRQQSISNIQDVIPDVVDNYILYLQGTRENPITVNTILRSVRAFLCMVCRRNSSAFRLLPRASRPLLIHLRLTSNLETQYLYW